MLARHMCRPHSVCYLYCQMCPVWHAVGGENELNCTHSHKSGWCHLIGLGYHVGYV